MGLEVRDLVKSYGEKTVVDHLSFRMDKPGVYALLGTNGAGKTTSIRMILGMLAADSGSVTLDGKPLADSDISVGYLAEERGLYPKVSVLEQVLYFASLKGIGKKEAEKRIMKWCSRLRLTEYFYPEPVGKKKAKPFLAEQLSKGNQQKVQLMSALIADPKLVVLDEPMSGLDPVNMNLFRDVIKEEAEKDKYIIMSSHQMGTIEEFCSDITIMNRGKTILKGNINEIKRGYGRINLVVKADTDLHPYIDRFSLNITDETPNGIFLRLSKEAQAGILLRALVDDNVPLVHFELTEPSLHEIFVEKVEGVNEQSGV